jgi:chromate reductase
MKKIILISGSKRDGSLNTKLIQYAANILNDYDGIQSEIIDLSDYDMPIYDGDDEDNQGLPKTAAELKKKFQECDGFIMASPEYNGFFTPLLKNVIDWTSRPYGDENKDAKATYKGKIAAIAACSPGGLGGIRGLPHLRTLLSGIGVHVVPTQTSIGNATSAFDDNNQLKDGASKDMLLSQIDQFIDVVHKL